jgi:hypothetical protein
MSTSASKPLSQQGRPPCSLPLVDADLSLGNANWIKGLQAETDWIWTANLNPVAFPNNLGRYLLHIPGVFEQQLNYSTTLTFDEPSFRNGVQMSGFVDRVQRELVISYIAQSRRCWYSMTHHALLGYLTAKKHGLSDATYVDKWTNLLNFRNAGDTYSDVELAILEFAEAFGSDPKRYTDAQYAKLRAALLEDSQARYPTEGKWMQQLDAARAARRLALARGETADEIARSAAQAAADVGDIMSAPLTRRTVDAQVVELAFVCLQFVALADVLTSLNVPDEDHFAETLEQTVPAEVVAFVNDLCAKGGAGLGELLPARVRPPVEDILAGKFTVAPVELKARSPRLLLQSYELTANDPTPDKGLAVGGIQTGVYGWGFGAHEPGTLAFCLELHQELARYEAPYSLPLLFNEDEWRNGSQTSGYVSRLLKELVHQKVYQSVRSRYELNSHTLFLFNSYLDLYGVGRQPRPEMTPHERDVARHEALRRAELAALYTLDHQSAPPGTFSDLETAALSWVQLVLTQPHNAHREEARLRAELDKDNEYEIAAGVRKLDTTGGVDAVAARRRLVDHQIAELVMIIGHTDGLGRAATMLQFETEGPVQVIEGTLNSSTGGIKPTLNDRGEAVLTGYFNNRLGVFQAGARVVGVPDTVLTMNELLANPALNAQVQQRLDAGETGFHMSASDAEKTSEF